MVMNLKNIIKEEMDDLGWVKNTYPTLGDAWDDGLINRGDILTLSGTLVDTNGRNPIEVDDLKIKIDKKSEKINASYFYLLNDKYAKHLGVESDYRDRKEKIRFYTTDGKLRILELIRANNINESDELDWVKDIEPRLPLKIGTCLTFKQYEEEEDWVEDEYGNMVDHGKMNWHIIGKFIDEYNDNKPTFKMVATDRMGEGREIWMEVEKVKELYDEGVYKPCKKQTYLKRIMKEEINDFNWLDSQSGRPLHNVTFKVKGYPETLYTIKDSGLRSSVKIKWVTNAGFMMDGDWSDGVEEESTYMRDAVNKFFKIGEWIPTDAPITESSDLDWVKKELSSEGPLDGIRFTIPKSLVPRKIRVIEDKDGDNEWVSVFWQTDDKDDIRSEIYPREMVERYLNDGWWRKIKRGLKEEDELEWIKDQVNTKLAKNENWILVNDIDRESITEGHEIQKYLFDLGYSWGRSDSMILDPEPLCIYAIYHFGHDTSKISASTFFANRIYYQSGCRDAEIRIANKDIESGKYMVYYWSDLKPKTIKESNELDWIKNTIPNKWDYFEELIKDEPDINIEKNEDGEWVDLKDAQRRRYFGSGFSTEYELDEDIKSNSLPDFLNAISQHIEVNFQGYDYEQDEDYWDFLTLKEVLEKANKITQ